MIPTGTTSFETAVGRCTIVWSDAGISGFQLPEEDETAGQAYLRRRFPHAIEQAPPPAIAQAIDEVVRLLQGEKVDLSALALDLSDVSDFDRRVYEIARTIPASRTLTYGDIAAQLGDSTLSRAVGQSLGRNPIPVIVPCHRVLAAGGRPGGFSAPGGLTTKRRLLEIEGATDLHPLLPWS